MRLQTITLLVPILLAAGCAEEQSSDPCVAATELITECYGEEASSAYKCDPETAENIAALDCGEMANIEMRSDMTLCSVTGFFCPVDPIFEPNPTGPKTKYPILFAHGFNASPTSFGGFNMNIIKALRKQDLHEVYVAQVNPFQSVEHRSVELSMEIDRALEKFGSEKVNIIAQSMGGLDARYVISAMGYQDKIASLVTVATPHRGTRVADSALGLIPDWDSGVLDYLTGAFAGTFSLQVLADNVNMYKALEGLSEAAAVDFNRTMPDSKDIYYQSWAGLSNVGRISADTDVPACEAGGGKMYFSDELDRDFMAFRLVGLAGITSHSWDLVPSDGMVAIASARWGDFKGCIPADHYDTLGQVGGEEFNTWTGFDAVAFYRSIAFDLAGRGF